MTTNTEFKQQEEIIPTNIEEIWLNAFVRENDSENSYIPKPWQFRMSGLAECVRKQQYRKICPERARPYSDEELGTFAMGRALETAAKNAIQKKYAGFILETPRKDGQGEVRSKFGPIELIGHYDFLTLHPELGLKVWDCKTVKGNAWKYKLDEKTDPSKVSEGYYLQSNAYANILGISQAGYFYISKDNAMPIGVTIQVSKRVFIETQEKEANIYESILEGVMLDGNPGWSKDGKPDSSAKDEKGTTLKGKECEYCKFSHLCYDFTEKFKAGPPLTTVEFTEYVEKFREKNLKEREKELMFQNSVS